MAKSAIDLTRISEPAADPTLPDSPPAAALNLPKAAPVAAPPKVSARREYSVRAIVDGVSYGPFTATAVDESEAITRVLDEHQQLKARAPAARFQVKPAAA